MFRHLSSVRGVQEAVKHCYSFKECFCLFGFRKHFFVCLFVILVLDTGFLCIALAVLELRNPPASASQVLGLKVCATIARLLHQFLNHISL